MIIKDKPSTPLFVIFAGMACDYVTLRVQILDELEELLHEIGAKIILLLAFAPLTINRWPVARAA